MLSGKPFLLLEGALDQCADRSLLADDVNQVSQFDRLSHSFT
jgi:hypothetical protein